MADVMRRIQHQQRIVRHIVERVTIRDGEVETIDVRSEARPFFDGSAMAPPDGSGGARPASVIEGVSELVTELLAA